MKTETTGERILRLIHTIVLCRHGKAVKINPTDKDEERQLNELGLRQSMRLGKKLDSYNFDVVLSSPLPSARMTLAVATIGKYVIHPVPELTCGVGDGSPIDIMWNELSNVPLEKYLEHSLSDALRVWADAALNAVLESVSRLRGHGSQSVLVGGHALLQNALANQIALELVGTMSGETAYKMAVTEILSEGEAFVFKFDRLSGDSRILAEHLRLD